MLRDDVVKAAAEGRFHVYPVSNISQGLELLTGIAAGERDWNGKYPNGSLNALVEGRLRGFAEARQKFAADKDAGLTKGNSS